MNEASTDTDVTDEPIEDMANRLAMADFGIRDTNGAATMPSSGLSLSSEPEEDGLRLPDRLPRSIEIKTEAPLTIEIITPERTGSSVAFETPVQKVIAHEREQPSKLGEKHGSEILHDLEETQGAAVMGADRKDFLEPDEPIENGEESNALGLSATIGLAGVVLQNSMGNKSKLSPLISRPASAPNIPPNTTPQKSAVDEHASNPNGSDHHRSASEDTDRTET